MNFGILLARLIMSQLISNHGNQFIVNQQKQISFFKAQLDYKLAINTLPDGSNNSFEPLLFHADQSTNDTLHYSQAMKATDAEDFKLAINKEIANLKEAGVFKLIPISEKPKDRKLIRFIWSF